MLDERPGATSADAGDCLFCRSTDPDANKVILRSERFYARLDNFPAARGHVEIVPNRHVESLFELSVDEVAEAYSLMHQVQQQLQVDYAPDGFTVGINDGRAAGRTVDHLHIHLIPRFFGDVADPRGGIRQIVPNCNPAEWTRG